MTLLLDALALKPTNRAPIWMMRQAGRYLPEYRELRAQTPNFLEFCYSPNKACEVTLQPLRRFNFDAAILFADILTIPDALGLDVKFVKGDGPKLDKIKSVADIDRLKTKIPSVATTLKPVFEAVTKIRKGMNAEDFTDTTLIGFCGAPWTVAAYMLDDKPSKDTANLRKLAYADPAAFDDLMSVLVVSSIAYLNAQIEAGAEVVQIFDSWANSVPTDLFEKAVQEPLLAICAGVKVAHPQVPIILFPKGVSERHLAQLVRVGAKGALKLFDGMGISHTQDLAWAADNIMPHVAIQGNLDPAVLLAGPEVTKRATQKILDMIDGRPGFIFNLGHGVTPPTPIESVAAMVNTVQNRHK